MSKMSRYLVKTRKNPPSSSPSLDNNKKNKRFLNKGYVEAHKSMSNRDFRKNKEKWKGGRRGKRGGEGGQNKRVKSRKVREEKREVNKVEIEKSPFELLQIIEYWGDEAFSK